MQTRTRAFSFGDVTRDDGTFPSEEICAYYERTRELPRTSGSTPEDFSRACAGSCRT